MRHPSAATARVVAILAVGTLLGSGCESINAATGSAAPSDATTSAATQSSTQEHSATPRSTGSDGNASEALDTLERLPVRDELDVDYDRDDWQPSWRVLPDRDDHCDVRQYSLKQEGTYIDADGGRHKHARVDDECDPYEKGDPELDGGYNQWSSPYDGETTSDSSTFDADHFIALEEVARSGGAKWADDRKEEFGMYSPDVIIMVSAHSNRSKGSDDPANWMPSQESYHCAYAARWVQLKHDWDLAVDQDEHDALDETLSTCVG